MRLCQFIVLVLGTLAVVFTGCGKMEESATVVYTTQAPKAKAEAAQAAAPMASEPTAKPMRFGDVALDAEKSAPAESDLAISSGEESRTQEPQRFQFQPGTLTAGSLNDHKNFDEYRQYLSGVQQSARSHHLPAFNIGERVEIEVKDAQGNGVSDVQIILSEIGATREANEGILLHTTTRADGKAFFATGLDARSERTTFELTIKPRAGQAVVKQVSTEQSPWIVELPDFARKLPEQLDLALVVDTTQSMADELSYLQVELDNIVGTVHKMFPQVEQRYALIVYRDEGDEYVVRNVIDFTSSLPEFREELAAQSAQGGGDIPEAMHLALENSTRLSWRHENTARVMFLVADAPPHQQHVDRTLRAIRELRREGVAVYPLAASGALDECEFLMRAAAFLTRGQYLFLTDHSGVGNPHAIPHAPRFEVEPLNQLMVRMIASELSGKPVLAQDIIATEESQGSEPPPIPQEQNQTSTFSPAVPMVDQEPIPLCGTRTCVSVWDMTWIRIVGAVFIISGILYLDNRLRV